MSTYYEYQDVKVMIAHKLMSMDGWKVYGYYADNSDPMIDYFDPASWGGVAEKNGYILCVNVYGKAEPQEIREYKNDSSFMPCNRDILEKIIKLQQMTMEHGASQQEEESAKMMIAKLQKKMQDNTESNEKNYIVTGVIPGHLENPPRCNWHIEKDGVIVAKGSGILKYSSIDHYYNYGGKFMKPIEEYKKDKRAYAEKYARELIENRYYSEEKVSDCVKEHLEDLEKDIKLINDFESFINKLDTTCGALLGEGENFVYEKVVVTEYKKELKPVETTNGSIKDGQCFILKSNFNYGCRKGLVYRIHATEYDGKVSYHANKLNGKFTKECTGHADTSNYWYIGSGKHDNLTKWIEKGAIAWCELKEVKTPYEVEKVIKKVIKAETKKEKATRTTSEEAEETKATSEETNVHNYTYEVVEDTDTRDSSQIWLVKVKEKLSREDYIKVNQYIKSIGGYYSKFKHSFLFKENPTEKLRIEKEPSKEEVIETREEPTTPTAEKEVVEPVAETEETKEDTEEPKEETINYTIEEDIHTKTKEKLWIVKPDEQLSKEDFAKVKQRLAVLKGFYSSYKSGFIFKYDPTEKLKTG